MPTLMALAAYLFLTISRRYPMYYSVLWTIRQSRLYKSDSGLTPTLFSLAWGGTFSVIELTLPRLQLYKSHSTELSMQDGCILWGSCVVIPQGGRGAVLHEGYPGLTRMKRLARVYVW